MEQVSTRQRPASWLWAHPSALLLAVQLLGILAYPYMDDVRFGRAVFEIFGIVVLALVVRSIKGAPWVIWSALGLGLVAAGLSVADAFWPSSALVVAGGVLHAILYFATAGSLLRYMLRDRRVTLDEMFAIGATFTLVAWAFAYVYVALEAVQPDAFGGGPHSWMELLFLSVTTLTSTGLSDIVPLTPHARSYAMIEQIAGLTYVALVVSRLVGLTIRTD